MRNPAIFILTCFVGLILLAGGMGCANIVPPAGGPRDSIPPRLLQAVPPDSNVNFRGKRIVLHFDEYVDVRNPMSSVIVTPTMSTPPGVSRKGRSVEINFTDSLLPNTTYIIEFGNSIVDVNEGNPLSNFVYTFSTGPVLDSLEIKGRVILAETGTIDTTLIVALHANFEDSAVINQTPRYMVKLNRQGEFRFRFLPADTFAIYAIEAGTGARGRYTNKSQLFAFANQPVVSGQTDSVVLYAYREKPKASGPSTIPATTRISATDRRLRFNAPQGTQDLNSDYVLNFPIPLRDFDSTKIYLSTDSLFNPVPFTAQLDTSGQQVRISTNWLETTGYNLILDKEFATDTAGRQLLKTDTLFFSTKALAEYGEVRIRLRNVDPSQNPVLLFVQNNQVVFSAPVSDGIFDSQLFVPGEYSLRILYDENGNGKWDPGNFFGEKRQPELVKSIERTITVKPAWENEFDIAL